MAMTTKVIVKAIYSEDENNDDESQNSEESDSDHTYVMGFLIMQ